ncbi:AAA family ATPase [Frateuria hangzhouensis]|uniref:AAA family ATPase n=1 Tax=Frateuria hangzhouensis TaxID=2995589 RepID=UPI002260C99C|nr:AAA family ATPase [Frateuria sp. STR12]MCX7515406.1 AAA family ATPase [Frateuria sp. STR12]
MSSQHFYVITGASGAGKSTLIAALAGRGYRTVPEAGLAILRERRDRGVGALLSTDRAAFLEAVLARSLEDYTRAIALGPPVFFDRGIPEWLRFAGCGEMHCNTVAARHRYASTVFVAEPWPEIYVQDHERVHSFNKAAASYERTISAYTQAGYETCILPKASVQERVAFVLAHVAAGAQQIAAADRHPATRAVGG